MIVPVLRYLNKSMYCQEPDWGAGFSDVPLPAANFQYVEDGEGECVGSWMAPELRRDRG